MWMFHSNDEIIFTEKQKLYAHIHVNKNIKFDFALAGLWLINVAFGAAFIFHTSGPPAAHFLVCRKGEIDFLTQS